MFNSVNNTYTTRARRTRAQNARPNGARHTQYVRAPMQNGNQKRARENQKRARERATRALRAYTYAGVNNYRERPGIRNARAKARARVPVQAWICTEIVVEICVPAAAVERICFIFLFMFLKILWKSIREFAGYLVAAIFG